MAEVRKARRVATTTVPSSQGDAPGTSLASTVFQPPSDDEESVLDSEGAASDHDDFPEAEVGEPEDDTPSAVALEKLSLPKKKKVIATRMVDTAAAVHEQLRWMEKEGLDPGKDAQITKLQATNVSHSICHNQLH